jgi:hypothetical protein
VTAPGPVGFGDVRGQDVPKDDVAFRTPVVDDYALRRQLPCVHEPFMELQTGDEALEELGNLCAGSSDSMRRSEGVSRVT